MKTYTIIFNETVMHPFKIEANSEDEAEAKFERMANDGELDFSDGEVIDSSIKVYDDQNN